MMQGMRIALGANDIIDVMSIEFDVGTNKWYVRTFEKLAPEFGCIMAVGHNIDLNNAMTMAGREHAMKREWRLARARESSPAGVI